MNYRVLIVASVLGCSSHGVETDSSDAESRADVLQVASAVEDADVDSGTHDAGDATRDDADTFDVAPDVGTCDDTYPGSDTLATATVTAATTDCQLEPLAIAGSLGGPGDVDFFKLEGVDTPDRCDIFPTVRITSTAPVQVCAFSSCHSEYGIGTCVGTGVNTKVMHEGRQLDGCCALGEVQLAINCQATTDDSDTFVSVSAADVDSDESPQCVDYALEFTF